MLALSRTLILLFSLKLTSFNYCHCLSGKLEAGSMKLSGRVPKLTNIISANKLAGKSFRLPPISFKLKTFRCLYRRCLPLPIPNREVKPARADGTAVKRGRVGRCPILNLAPFSNIGGFFCDPEFTLQGLFIYFLALSYGRQNN